MELSVQMRTIPKVYQKPNYEFIRIKKDCKRPVSGENWKKGGRKYNDPELLEWLKEGGNIALINKSVGITIDADSNVSREYIEKNLPKTLTVQSSNINGMDKRHFTYKKNNLTLPTSETTDKVEFKELGDIRGTQNNYYTLIPPSIHEKSGEPYKLITDMEPAELTQEQLDNFINFCKSKMQKRKTINEGSRNNSLFKFASKLKRENQVYELVLMASKGENNTYNPPLPESEVITVVNSAFSYKEKEEPKIELTEKTMEKLRSPKLLDYIIEEVHKEQQCGEEDTIKALTFKLTLRLVNVTTNTSKNTVISDDTGLGKDNIAGNICKVLVPKHLLYHRTHITDKVLNYWVVDEKGNPINWDDKVLYFEDPDKEAIKGQAFRVFATGNNETTGLDDKRKVIHKKVVGKPVILVTSAQQSIDDEGVRRWDGIKLDDSTELTKEIVNSAWDENPYNPDENFRAGLKQLKRYKVTIPYRTVFKNELPTHSGMRTAVRKLKDYILVSTVLHQHNREKTEDGKLIATWDDYENARWLFLHMRNDETGGFKNKDEQLFFEMLSEQGELITIDEAVNLFDRQDDKWIYNNKGNWKKRGLLELKKEDRMIAGNCRKVIVLGAKTFTSSKSLPTVKYLQGKIKRGAKF